MMPKILVINSGSSSLKCSLFSFTEGDSSGEQSPRRLASGGVDRIGEDKSCLSLETEEPVLERECRVADHAAALEEFLEALVAEMSSMESLEEISAVGHRVVHGGEAISESVAVDDAVINAVEENAELAPLHNPPNLTGLRASMERLPGRLQVAVFDTAFHQSMPPRAYLYAIPYEMYEENDVRRYGFHGTSHRYVAERGAKMLGQPLGESNLITLHLGNGCSATAVRQGQSVDTSMGLTPLEGLVMGTRCGDIDPSLPHLMTLMVGMSSEEVYDMLNRQSGLLGLSGISNDMREIISSMEGEDDGADRAEKALEVFSYYVKKYIGSYWAILGDLHGIVFTAGIGENCPVVREKACSGMENMGLRLNPEKNEQTIGTESIVSASDSDVPVMVVPTDEELKIAMDTFEIYCAEK
jgi:acetate kinase